MSRQFPGTELILFGSKARCDYAEFSDLDILVLVDQEVEAKTEELIFDIAYDVDLEFDVVISAIVESKNFWESNLAQAMPLHWNVDKEGVPL
jgi:predicted nucleotidyltransferase